MRTLVAAAVASLLIAPSSAGAQEGAPLCVLGGGSHDYQATLGSLLVAPGVSLATGQPRYPGGGGAGAAREALGAQYAGLWFEDRRQGWSVAISPGALTAETAREAIRAALATRFDAPTVTYLDDRLAIYTTPYSRAELNAVQAQVTTAFDKHPGLLSTAAIGCTKSDAYRVELGIGPAATPEIVATVRELVAPFGDKVRVAYGIGWAVPVPGIVLPLPQPPQDREPTRRSQAPRVADYVSLPRASRCVRGKAVSVKVARRADVRSVTLAAGKRKATAASGKRARLALKRRTTKVTVTIRLRDGRTATQTITYVRC